MKRIIAIIAFSLGVFTGFAQSDNVIITEFMASNDKVLADEDGDFSDWIEIYNAGTNTVNLNNWKLADSNTQWAFPATNIAPNKFMVIFASNKNRRIPGRNLHTNFKLDASSGNPPVGERVSLLRPDSTVASSYNPPVQVEDISYGIPITIIPVTLVSTGAPGKFFVPANDIMGTDWTQAGFNDGAWAAVQNGIGFETDPAPTGVSIVIADSVTEFSGTQGSNNWYYGYWNKKDDTNFSYQLTDFIQFPRGTDNILSSGNYWNGTNWNWPPPADPPWTELTSTGGHPAGANGNPSAAIHWTIRRYVSEAAGTLRLSGTLAASGQSGTCGDGTIGHIFVDGVEVFQRAVFNRSVGYSILVNASVGSVIDFAIDPGAADNDSCDTTTFTATVRNVTDMGLVADTIADWSDTGVQGKNGWTYGSFIRTNTGLAYSTSRFGAFPSGGGPHSSDNFWNGEMWQWFDGDPPFDRIGQYTAQPSIFTTVSSTNAQEHWVIRRWVSEIAGTLHVDMHLSKQDVTGGGASAKIFRNGVQVGTTLTVAGGDFAGITRTEVISNVQVGDLIDFSIEPGADIVGDSCFFNASIYGVTTLSNQFQSDVRTAMQNVNSSSYLRLPFTINNAFAFNSLVLRLKYDDGANVYINGELVASRNASGPRAWNAVADGARIDADASEFEEIDLFELAPTLLHAGNNVLAIQGLNSSAADGDFLIVAELKAGITSLDQSHPTYFYSPTPGSENGTGSSSLGPIITDISHTPHDPADDEDMFVTARIIPVLHPPAPNGIVLRYRVMFGNEVSVVMQDDGLNWDGAAGDGIFGGRVPKEAAGPGQMVRYYITATDTNAGTSRQPPYPHSQFSAQYFGAVVKNPALTNPLEVLHMFVTEPSWTQANNSDVGRNPASLYFLGEFYDNVGINRHGQSSQGTKFTKKSFDIDFNGDHTFRWDVNQDRVDDINLLTTQPDKGAFRNILAYGTLRDAGAPHHFVRPVRMDTNGGFCGIWHMLENGDERYLKRIGKDPRGALYKMYNTFTDISHTTIGSGLAEKKTRREEGNADLQALFNGVATGTAQARTNYMWDNINVAASINTFSARALTSEWDCCHKNYYFYRDSDGSGEWEAMAWDMDLSFGRNWSGAAGIDYWDATVYTQNGIFGNWLNNTFFQLLLNGGQEPTRRMYLRRARTLADELQQTNGTPANLLNYERQLAELQPLLAPDAALDLAKYGTWGNGVTGIKDTNSVYWQTLAQAMNETRTNYMIPRRNFVFGNRWGMGTDFPDAQSPNVKINFGAMEYNPSSGNQLEEYIQLINTNNTEVDISHWKLAGAIEHTFQGGVVIPRNGGLVYVVPDKKAFRNRATAPRRGMGLFVEGNYKGQLSARGETLYLSNKIGTLVSSNRYIGNPTPAQNALRVTEIMYHPTVPVSGPFDSEQYEYLELRNISGTSLNLNGVKFVSGIEFTFGNTSLAPGAYILVVKNIAAFQLKYGPGFNIAGQYVGSLDNGGENIEILDAVGEKVQDFRFNNSWYPITDGAGASLVIKNDQADWDSWGLKDSWRPSTYDNGTPGAGDSPAITVAPVLVNEVLTHTDFPELDKIELRSTNSSTVNIGGWFISDDFEQPKKFRIPDGTTIAPGGYIVFDEDDFNPNPLDPASFAFSSLGDEAYLFSGDGTNITGYFHGFEFGAAETGVAFARYIDSVTNEHFVATSTNTFNGPNAYPKVGPIVISEIMYHPVGYGDGVDNSVEEYIELHNPTTNAVPLYDINAPENTWRVRGGVDFNFPTNQTLAAGGFALLVNFNLTNTPVLDAFRSRYGLSPSVPIYGPYDGRLNNAGDSVRLQKPDAPTLDDLGNPVVPYIVVERVDYLPIEPWPLAADGIGAALQRKIFANFANDPANWGGGISPGTLPGDQPPTITGQSPDQTTIEGHTLTINVAATGSQPLIYQWRFNSNNIPGGGGGSLVIPNITTNQAGWYNVIIFNSAGSAESTYIHVDVLFAPQFTRQPLSTNVILGNNATFTVAADSENGPNLTYQWWFRDASGDHLLAGATTTSYSVTGVKLTDDGYYYATVTDPIDTVRSDLARLRVLVPPFYIQLPISQFVPQGGTATVSAAVTNNATQPVTFRWRRIGGAQTNIIVFGTSDYYTVTNVQGSNRYDVIAFNEGRTAGFQSPQFFIAAIVDADGDGLPDQWETDNGVTDPDADPDGDTMSNLAEYIAGTNPNDGQSYLKVDKLTLGAGAAVRFNAVSNKTYTVEYTDGLGTSPWTRLADTYATSNSGPVTVTDPNFTAKRFYRLATPKKK
ncbi:MAG TPA: lamin tail domain-containing protein [Verrucomicrobiae bacterium]|nr:lamin tail domain-containing protein [Verrucomicrobiae bacterium]